MITLSSEDFRITIDPFGAELKSVIHIPSETEFIWQANQEVWPRHAPVLFPFVGRLNNFQYRHNKQTYTIEQHGFARDLMFEVISQSDLEVVLELTNTAHTMQRYPFIFSFKVTFSLNHNSLTMGFEVENKSNGPMPVSFGGHPAFNIKSPEDTSIVFENDLDPKTWKLKNNMVTNTMESVTDGKGKIHVNAKTFEGDALIFKNLNSHWVKLQSNTTGYAVKVSINGWPYLGIWAKPASDFVCLEPWQGLADNEGFAGEVKDKEGIVMLDTDEVIKKSFMMAFFPH